MSSWCCRNFETAGGFGHLGAGFDGGFDVGAAATEPRMDAATNATRTDVVVERIFITPGQFAYFRTLPTSVWAMVQNGELR